MKQLLVDIASYIFLPPHESARQQTSGHAVFEEEQSGPGPGETSRSSVDRTIQHAEVLPQPASEPNAHHRPAARIVSMST